MTQRAIVAYVSPPADAALDLLQMKDFGEVDNRRHVRRAAGVERRRPGRLVRGRVEGPEQRPPRHGPPWRRCANGWSVITETKFDPEKCSGQGSTARRRSSRVAPSGTLAMDRVRCPEKAMLTTHSSG